MEISMEASQKKLKVELPYDPAITVLCVFPSQLAIVTLEFSCSLQCCS